MTRCQLEWNAGGDAELALRIRPLREHWEARGPGMLAYCRKRMPWCALPASLEIQLIRPERGGGGHVVDNRTIAFEAVLANRWPQLPEVVRLTWLILCASDPAAQRQPASLVPLALEAAEFVELSRCDADTLHLALTEWLQPHPEVESRAWLTWWQTTGRTACECEEAWTEACLARTSFKT